MTKRARKTVDTAARRTRNLKVREGKLPQLTARGWPSSVLIHIADQRLAEARQLRAKQFLTGSAYLAGYAVEIILKALIAERHFGSWLPLKVQETIKTHNLEVLLKKYGLDGQLKNASEKNKILRINWAITKQWKTEIRYLNLKKPEADDIFQSIACPANGTAGWFRIWATGHLS